MQTKNFDYFSNKLTRLISVRRPVQGLIELTYRCNLNCVHCYCKGCEDKELATNELKGILDQLRKEGCLFLGLSGGEPLMREDFLELYLYARAKGFLIDIMTNGQLFNRGLIRRLRQFPPIQITITLNGITEDTYEKITQVPGSFARIMEMIEQLRKENFKIVIKANCLSLNKDEIPRIKEFTYSVFGKDKKRFQYDPMIYPRLNGDLTPCKYRLSAAELINLIKSDSEMWDEFSRQFSCNIPQLDHLRCSLYLCRSWVDQFFISPSGRVKFCVFTEKYSSHLKEIPFHKAFYNIFPKVGREKYKTSSKCRACFLRARCYNCPVRAYLEVKDEERQVKYYCDVAHSFSEKMKEMNTVADSRP